LMGEEGITTGRFAIGITMDSIGVVRLPFFQAITQGFSTTVLLTRSTIEGLVKLVKDIFSGSAGIDSVSGPVGIVGLVGDAQTLGFAFLISLTAIISINLAVINLVPFPALDGGRLLFIIIESIIRRPISKKVTTYVNTIGFILLLTLMLVISISDIFKIL
ncbi:MAG: site-2 protease family protein, partial [Patescibacteria group bacterium]